MAEIVLQAVIRKAIEVTSNLVIQEGYRLSKVKEDVSWIESEMRYIQSYLEDADAKQGGDRTVAALVSDIRRLGMDVEDIIDTYFPEIVSPKRKGILVHLRSPFDVLHNISTARKFIAEIEGIRGRVNDINRRRQTYGIQEKSNNRDYGSWDARRSFPHLDEPNVVSFEEHIKKLVGRIQDEDLPSGLISITGMAGLGKTTLAKKVYNSVQQSFDCSAWICVMQQPNVAELLRDIARQVGLEKAKWEHNVEPNLFEFLSHKRYIIVIDDMWQTQPWDALKRGIPNNCSNGARIIVTSRNKDVGMHVGGQDSLHELQPLDQQNSRNIFYNIVGSPLGNMKEQFDRLELENISDQILKKCGGVPLAIILTAGMLLQREATKQAWSGVLERIGQEEDECSKIFSLSYKDLPTSLKPCFLYFGFFPEDHEIIVSNLIDLWAVEGFIRGSGVREVQEVGGEVLNHLIARNLIQVARRNSHGKSKSLRIHDILHSLCVRVAKEINFFSSTNDLAAGNSTMRVRRLNTYHTMLSLGEEYEGELKTKIIKNFSEDLRFLRVLCLEDEVLPFYLPREIGFLSQLFYIRLKTRYGRTKLPSTIRNLKNLEVLDAWNCIIPKCIWRMEKVRHIMLRELSEIEFCSGGLWGKFLHSMEASSLNLQTLHWLNIYHPAKQHWFPKFTSLRRLGVCFGDLLNVKELLDAITVLHKLEELRLKFKVSFSVLFPILCLIQQSKDVPGHLMRSLPVRFVEIDIVYLNLSRFDNLSILHLQGSIKDFPEHDKLPPNLAKLTLRWSKLSKDPMETLKKLPKLRILKLQANAYIGKKMKVCPESEGPYNFPQLQMLELVSLYYLREFVVEEEVMPQLSKFRIVQCSSAVIRIPNRIRDMMITS